MRQLNCLRCAVFNNEHNTALALFKDIDTFPRLCVQAAIKSTAFGYAFTPKLFWHSQTSDTSLIIRRPIEVVSSSFAVSDKRVQGVAS